jgi:hypothetical protein
MMAFMVDILMSATVPACTPPRLDLDQAIEGSAIKIDATVPIAKTMDPPQATRNPTAGQP